MYRIYCIKKLSDSRRNWFVKEVTKQHVNTIEEVVAKTYGYKDKDKDSKPSVMIYRLKMKYYIKTHLWSNNYCLCEF